MRTRVLVTGANGQLAQSIKRLFEANEENIFYFFANRTVLDITQQERLKAHFKTNQYDYVVNCAAYTNVDGAEDDPESAFLSNAKAVEYLAKYCNEYEMVLIHISTDYVFDGKKEGAYSETDETNPINVYGASKLKGEKILQQTTSKHYIIRASWLYSPYGKNFLKTMSNLIKNQTALKVVDTQKGSPTSCFELARFIHFIIGHHDIEFGTYHFAAKNYTTWFGFAQYISSFYPDYKSSDLKPVSEFISKAKRPTNSVLAIDKTEKIYPDFMQWEAGVDEIMGVLLES
ncbi:MAG: dTDP-4-dehydrorhamnose reductase [Flavobacteriaceae bacterium]|nr:dTDP-4-dehydrorhamnose reductase [Flavobacteriaceae bacterium]RZW55617.1 MAG: dTDP-4-dehydrorhamnose reductase [Flavobacteriaceae bacterium]